MVAARRCWTTGCSARGDDVSKQTRIEWAMAVAAELTADKDTDSLLRDAGTEVITYLLAEVKALRAIITGSTVPPTDAELAAHALAYPTGGWVVSRPDDDTSEGQITGEPWGELARIQRMNGYRWRWIPLDGEGCPVARPVVES